MKKSIVLRRIIVLAIAAALLFMAAFFVSSNSAYKNRRENEKLDSIDIYEMHAFSEENSKAVMKALASGNADKLAKLMISTEGAESVMDFADWKKADFDDAVSMGSGSLGKGTDENGVTDISERFFVDIDGQRYLLFVETQTSRWGRINDGVSAVAVTTMEHFDELDWMWNGEPDDYSALAGELLWTD